MLQTREIVIGHATIPAGFELRETWETACNSTLWRTLVDQRVEVVARVITRDGLQQIEGAYCRYQTSKVYDDYTNRVFTASSHHHEEHAPGEVMATKSVGARWSHTVHQFIGNLQDFEPCAALAYATHLNVMWMEHRPQDGISSTPFVAVA